MLKQQADDPPGLIDLDRVETWPHAARQAAERQADKMRAKGDIEIADLFDHDADAAFRALLQGRRVLAYHCTRLLDHEATAIRNGGLTPLSKDSVNSRIDEAHRRGLVSDDDRELLRAATFLTTRQPQPRRAGAVYLFAPRSTLDDDVGGVWYLLAEWGGEAIRMTAESRDFPEHLVRLGKPSVVVTALDLTMNTRERDSGPPLQIAFAKTLLGDERHGFSVRSRIAVPASEILAIWQPGSADYDRHVELPTE